MNLKKVIGIGLLGLGATFVQAAPAPNETSAPAPVATEVATETPVDSASVAAEATPVDSAASADSVAAPVAAAEVAPVEAAPVDSAKVEETKAEPIAVPAAPVAQKQDAWFAEAAKTEPVVTATDTAASTAAPKKNPFDVLHGSAYNTVGNEAAADNVDGLLARPDKFAGRQFFYIEPSQERGVFSVGSLFGALDISGDLGRGTIGYANHGFGISVFAALGQYYFDSDDGTRYYTEAGDDIGLNASKVLGNYALVLNAQWTTYKAEVGLDPNFGASSNEMYRDLKGSLAITNAPGASGTNWTLGVKGVRHESLVEVGGKTIDDGADSYVKLAPFFNFGALGLKSEHAHLYAGVNASVPIVFFDEYEKNMNGKKVDQGLVEYGLELIPNLLGEVAITESVLIFGEANLDWMALAYGTGTDEAGSDYTALQSQMTKSTATVGFRYQHLDFAAIEFAFGDTFFTDTKSIFNGQGVFVSFGGFILF
ncbi:MAG: hypothetical protein HUK21_09630 [Fibrobacteraceae bacterium]|nr:hypothetical protein [Fibrobacteraceae bacterium]MCF0216719.1 hypothetical protein [Fibrobacteraceae bacterium]